MSIDLRQLRVLVAVDDERSFTAAADRLGMSQASVSRSLASLEHELGTALMHRTTRRVEPTDAGIAFTATARRVLAELDRAVTEARGERSVVRIGYAWAALGAHTTPVLRAWNRAHPATPLRLVRINRRDAGLVDGLVDLAVVRHPVERSDLDSELVGVEPRMVVLPVDHPLADRDAVGLAELVPFLVAVDRHTGTTSAALWTSAGLEAPSMTETGDVEEWLDLIAAGDAIGVTAEATAHQSPRPGVVFVRIQDAPPIEVHLAWHRQYRHPEATKVARAIRAAYDGAVLT
ncbi:LysR family transcriptional regulator [Agromyces sp. ISL-38]|uniref:LysR family transcriptional regulator n=1 Tax=Agromyces sp. ISL-38 TaxID=2819107 RepID=UPI001BE6B307|nr:LysR family transcriptional regulator [Agromyces sp. ISL-38]MBT2499524.1 LysR family transcriptional regulator [Agromyces sp. ISL-38]